LALGIETPNVESREENEVTIEEAMKQSDLEAEVGGLIHAKLDRGERAVETWLVSELLQMYPGIEGDDESFYLLCADYHLRHTVKRVLKKCGLLDETGDSRQRPFPSFPRVQRGYLLDEDGQMVLVPTEKLTRSQLYGKADDYEAMGRGCFEHADQLRRLADERFPEATASDTRT